MAANEAKRMSGRSPVSANQLITVEDPINFKRDLMEEIKNQDAAHTGQAVKR